MQIEENPGVYDGAKAPCYIKLKPVDKNFTSAGEILAGIFAKIKMNIEQNDKICGVIASIYPEVEVERFEKGELVLRCASGPGRQEISLREKELKKKIKAATGKTVKKIYFS